MRLSLSRKFVLLGALTCASLPLAAQERTGTVRLHVVPDRADWTYTLAAPVRFRITATRDGHPIPLAKSMLGHQMRKRAAPFDRDCPLNGSEHSVRGLGTTFRRALGSICPDH